MRHLKKRHKFLLLIVILVITTENLLAQDYDVDSNLQSWNVVRLTVPIVERWSLSMQNEIRIVDNVSKLDEYVFKLYIQYRITEKGGLSYGYKFIDLRGAPAMCYQSKNTMLIETEWLFNVNNPLVYNYFCRSRRCI